MQITKQTLVVAFAMFSLFFGAGNLILPPYLGAQTANGWYVVAFGFFLTAILVPILGIYAHAKLQGTMYDFGKKVSPLFSSVYCILMYVIAIALPASRTASVTHEIAVAPFFNSSAFLTSCIYFVLVFIFVINRSKLLDLIGKYLTPLMVLLLLVIICVGVYLGDYQGSVTDSYSPFSLITTGALEGYQTFDAIAGVIVGAVIIVSLHNQGVKDYSETKKLITQAGIIAGFGLLVIYGGLIASGYLLRSNFSTDASRTEVLTDLSVLTLGSVGSVFLSVLVALACFTTAVGIITGASDYVSSLFHGSKKAYIITAAIGSAIGLFIGGNNVDFIITVALPVLMFIYPLTIVLIVLHALPEKMSSVLVFRWVVLVTFIFSVPDFLKFMVSEDYLTSITQYIPLSSVSLGWVIPAVITTILVNLLTKKALKN
ncbi:branched-chain amino acid transport system II carrier protein [Bizionia sp. KMM 8389]